MTSNHCPRELHERVWRPVSAIPGRRRACDGQAVAGFGSAFVQGAWGSTHYTQCANDTQVYDDDSKRQAKLISSAAHPSNLSRQPPRGGKPMCDAKWFVEHRWANRCGLGVPWGGT